MKKLLFFISLFLMINHISAQNEMWIYQSDGSIIKYNTTKIDSIKFMPVEEPNDNVINITANQLIGNYYGENLAGGLGHYWIIMSDNGIVDGNMMPDSEFFRLDLLGPMADDLDNIRIPDGTYRFDFNSSFSEYSIVNMGSSDYTYVDATGEAWAYSLIDATLVVNGNNMELTAFVEDKEYHVTFSGDYSISYNPISDIISNLTSDHEIDLSNCTGYLTCYNNYWGCGYCNWGIEFICNDGLKNGTYLVLDFLTDANINGSSGIEGTYHSTGFQEEDPTQPAWAPYSFIPGMRISDDGTQMMGSLLQEYSNGIGTIQAPIFGGEFTITDNGDGTHTIVINATDDASPSHKITLNWTGELR